MSRQVIDSDFTLETLTITSTNDQNNSMYESLIIFYNNNKSLILFVLLLIIVYIIFRSHNKYNNSLSYYDKVEYFNSKSTTPVSSNIDINDKNVQDLIDNIYTELKNNNCTTTKIDTLISKINNMNIDKTTLINLLSNKRDHLIGKCNTKITSSTSQVSSISSVSTNSAVSTKTSTTPVTNPLTQLQPTLHSTLQPTLQPKLQPMKEITESSSTDDYSINTPSYPSPLTNDLNLSCKINK